MISLIACSSAYNTALGNHTQIDVVVRVLMGILFVLFGNYMPKCKWNSTIGIKVVWALRNEENWNKTHRFAGMGTLLEDF